MAYLPLRKIPEPEVSGVARDWLEQIASELRDESTDRRLLCRRALSELTFPQYSGDWETAVEDEGLPFATRLALSACDPATSRSSRNTTPTATNARFQKVKPLLWLCIRSTARWSAVRTSGSACS